MKEIIEQYCRYLKLPIIAQQYHNVAEESAKQRHSYETFLLMALEPEYIERREKGMITRIKQAKFPVVKTLDGFSFKDAPDVPELLVTQLSRGQYIKEKKNIIFLGNSGTGKTHLATGLAVAAIRQGLRVRFCTATGLVNELTEARDKNCLAKWERQWLKYQVVVIDELGYVPFTRTGAELLFYACSMRHEIGSIIITTNLEFKDWVRLFHDEHMTTALLDRVTQQAAIISLIGDSYRLRQSMEKPKIQ